MSVALTLDIDWAIDEVVADSLALITSHGARATWFATHESSMLATIRSSGHEVGLHPNFNPLLERTEGSMRDVFERVKALAHDARSVRSHSLVRSSRMSQMFREQGMTHESNIFIPPQVGAIEPWRDWVGVSPRRRAPSSPNRLTSTAMHSVRWSPGRAPISAFRSTGQP